MRLFIAKYTRCAGALEVSELPHSPQASAICAAAYWPAVNTEVA